MDLARQFDALRGLELTDAEVAAVLARAERRAGARRPRRRVVLAVAFAAAALAAAVAVAVPSGLAGLPDRIQRFFAGGAPPGEAIPRSRLPRWVADAGLDPEPRVLARSGDERLIAYRDRSGDVCFDFGEHVGLCEPSTDPESLFHGEPVTVWGPTHRDSAGRWVLWGIALDSVERVELRYSDAPPTRGRSTNGFVLRTRAGTDPTELVAFGDHGQTLATIDVRKRFALAPVGG
jgi:hypothetical protein